MSLELKHAPGSARADFAELLRHAWGRRIAWRLLFEYGQLHHRVANLDEGVDGQSRALLTYYAEGVRGVGRAIDLDLQQADLEAYTLMVKEGYSAAAASERPNQGESNGRE